MEDNAAQQSPERYMSMTMLLLHAQGHTCDMKVGPIWAPIQSTKMRPTSSRYAPDWFTASIVSGAGNGRFILQAKSHSVQLVPHITHF